MGLYTAGDIRKSWGAEWADASDAEVIQAYAKATGADVNQLANRLGYDPSGAGSLTRQRLGASVDSYQSNMYGLGEALAPKGSAVENWMRSGRQDNDFQSNVAQSRAKDLGGVDSYKDVDGIGSGLNYLGGLAAQSAPYLVEAAVPGAAVRYAGKGLNVAVKAGRALDATDAAVQAGKAAESTLHSRQMAGVVAGSYPSSVADILQNQREQLQGGGQDDGNVNLSAALVGGVPYSLLNAMDPSHRLAATGRIGRGIDIADAIKGKTGAGARLGLNVGVTGLQEGANELGQEFVNQGFGHMAVDPNETFFNDKSNERFKESFVGGMALGGSAGGAAGGWRRSNRFQEAQESAARAKLVEDRKTTSLVPAPGTIDFQDPGPITPSAPVQQQLDPNGLPYEPGYVYPSENTGPAPGSQIPTLPGAGLQQTVDGGYDNNVGAGHVAVMDALNPRQAPQSVAVNDGQTPDMFAQNPSAMVRTEFNPESEQGAPQGSSSRGVVASELRSQIAQQLGGAPVNGFVTKLSLDLADHVGHPQQMLAYVAQEQAKQAKELEKLNRKVDQGSDMIAPEEYAQKRDAIENRQLALVAAQEIAMRHGRNLTNALVQEGAAKAQPGTVVGSAPVSSATEQAMRSSNATAQTQPTAAPVAPNLGQAIAATDARVAQGDAARSKETRLEIVREVMATAKNQPVQKIIAAFKKAGYQDVNLSKDEHTEVRKIATARRQAEQKAKVVDNRTWQERRDGVPIKKEVDVKPKPPAPSVQQSAAPAVAQPVAKPTGATATKVDKKPEAAKPAPEPKQPVRSKPAPVAKPEAQSKPVSEAQTIISDLENEKDAVLYHGKMDHLYKMWVESPEDSKLTRELDTYVDENYHSDKGFRKDFDSAEQRYNDLERAKDGTNGLKTGNSTLAQKSTISSETLDALHNMVSRFRTTESTPESLVKGPKPTQADVQTIADNFKQTSKSSTEVPITVVKEPASIGVVFPGGDRPTGMVKNGQIFLFADNMRSKKEVHFTIYHELFHYGLEKVVDTEQHAALMRLFGNDPILSKYAQEWMESPEGVAREKTMNSAKFEALAVEEALAKLAEDVYERKGLGSRGPLTVRAAVRWFANVADRLHMPDIANALRKLTYTEAEKFVVAMANVPLAGEKSKAEARAKVKAKVGFEGSGDGGGIGFARLRAGDDPATPQSGQQAKETLGEKVEKTARQYGGSSGAIVAADTVHTVKRMVSSLRFLHDLVDSVKEKMLAVDPTAKPAVQDWYDSVQRTAAKRRQLEVDAEKIAVDAMALKGGTAKTNQFLSDSTYEQKWGYDPKFPNRTVAVDPAMAVKFNALSKEEQAVVKAVFAHGETMATQRRELLTKLGLEGTFGTSMSKLEGPYSPFKRFGDNWATLKSQELLDAEKEGDLKRVEELKNDPSHFVASAFDTLGQAKQFAYENHVANGGKFVNTVAWPTPPRTEDRKTMPANVLSKVMAAVKMSDVGEDPNALAVRSAIEKMVQEMYFHTLDEQNARTSGARRLNRAGWDADMIKSFLSNAKAEAGLLANLEHGGDTNDAFFRMQRQAAEGDRQNATDFNSIAAHYASTLDFKETPWQDRATALTSAWQLATSIGYHVTNATQGFVVTLPRLAADFNDYTGAWKHLSAGYAALKKTGVSGNLNLDAITDKGLRDALQAAADNNILDIGMVEDLTHFNRTRTGISAVDNITKVAALALHRLRSVSRMVETVNRVAAGVAAYNMAVEHGKTPEEAKAYTIKILRDTQGDFTRTDAPLVFKKLPKFVMQYKKFQFMMAALYAKAYNQAFHGATPEEKAIGRRMLAYKLFHTGMAAGVLGLPLMNMVGLVFAAMGGEGEPPDLERTLREMIGDPDTANLLLHGPMAMMGLDMSSKLGDENIFSIMPYGTFDVSSSAGLAKTALGLMGPAASQAAKFAEGIGYMKRGDYYKATEQFMPKGVSSALKSARIANEGYTLKDGKVLFTPDNINGLALAMDAIGMPSTELKRMDWIRNQEYTISDFYQKRTKALEQDYVKAVADGDTDQQLQIRQDWMELQQGKNHLRQWFSNSYDALKVQPLSTLLKAPMNFREGERKLQRQVSNLP